jgi:hypothetical protein
VLKLPEKGAVFISRTITWMERVGEQKQQGRQETEGNVCVLCLSLFEVA